MGPGKIRNPWVVILLSLVTLGIYSLYWQYMVFKELKDHTHQGLGGGLALVFAILLGIVNVFVLPAEIGSMYTREGQAPPTSALTGFWVLLPIAGWIVWVIRTQGSLNRHWETHGAVPA